MLESAKVPEYLGAIEDRGFIEVPDAFGADVIAAINHAIEPAFRMPSVNGRLGYVQCDNMRFISMALSWSRHIVDLYTNPVLVSVAEGYAGTPAHLSNYRVYRSYSSGAARMHWHVDNKTDRYDFAAGRFETEVVQDDKGLILILYLSDVDAGGLQLIEGSHLWTGTSDQESWDDQSESFLDRAVTFNRRPRGTAILYDYRCIHRAEPYWTGSPRTSLFAQYSPTTMPVGEPVLLNARDIPGLDESQKRVLNFGSEPTTLNWPIGEPEQLFSPGELLSMGGRLIRKRFKDAIKTGVRRWKSS
jgi:ectoine hydroxylase-related dioxygenase (phytanoyl-CoA dioxygenase family)